MSTVIALPGWQASASGYFAGRQRAGQVHLIPPPGTFPRRGVPITASCGAPWWDATNAPREAVSLADPLPDDLTWCPKCLAVAADVLGVVDQVAALVLRAIENEAAR